MQDSKIRGEVNDAASSSANSNLSLNDAAKANRETGMLLTTKEQLVTAIQDRRLHRLHLRVLAAVATFMNASSGKAWPGRAAIAALLGISVKTVSNLLLELRNFGYLIGERERVPEASNRSLMVYTWGKIDHDTIRREIEYFVQGVREGRIPAKHHSDQSPSPLGQSQPDGTSKSQPLGTSGAKVPTGRVRKSQPVGDSNSYKKLEDPYGGAVAPEEASLKHAIWKIGLTWLVRAYDGHMAPKEVRSWLAKLVSDHGQGAVLHALGKADETKAIAPLEFMTKILNAQKASGSSNPAARADAKRKLDLI